MILGQISLNLSFLMYMFLYLPQVIHNQKQTTLVGLSKWMHLILYTAYFLDLVYGFGTQLPWQYRTVSGVGWMLLTVQHLQLIHYFKRTKQIALQIAFYSVLIIITALLIGTLSSLPPFMNLPLPAIGYIAQIGFAIAFIPQILRSKRLHSSQAMNIFYLLLCIFLATLDCVSAWQLEWGWPNKLGSCCLVVMTSILLMQYYQYQFGQSNSALWDN